MEDKNCQQLFEYLRSILYDAHVQPLDISTLDEPYRKLGMGLQCLDRAVQELKAYSAALSVGNLSDCSPSRDNPLCENLKNMQANLNHLTWQAKQVAKGDYSQTVSYLGEFSEAFNTMTAQLREREKALKKEAQLEKDYADSLKLEAHFDPLTGIGNRYDFYQKLDALLETDDELVFCYCDLDHLKFINDTYGHAEGDKYLLSFTDLVKRHLRASDIFARMGGDEFCAVLRSCSMELAQRKITHIQNDFAKAAPPRYHQCFSCGLVHLAQGPRHRQRRRSAQAGRCRHVPAEKNASGQHCVLTQTTKTSPGFLLILQEHRERFFCYFSAGSRCFSVNGARGFHYAILRCGRRS